MDDLTTFDTRKVSQVQEAILFQEVSKPSERQFRGTYTALRRIKKIELIQRKSGEAFIPFLLTCKGMVALIGFPGPPRIGLIINFPFEMLPDEDDGQNVMTTSQVERGAITIFSD